MLSLETEVCFYVKKIKIKYFIDSIWIITFVLINDAFYSSGKTGHLMLSNTVGTIFNTSDNKSKKKKKMYKIERKNRKYIPIPKFQQTFYFIALLHYRDMRHFFSRICFTVFLGTAIKTIKWHDVKCISFDAAHCTVFKNMSTVETQVCLSYQQYLTWLIPVVNEQLWVASLHKSSQNMNQKSFCSVVTKS